MQCACAMLLPVSAPLYTVFPHYLINGTIVENKLSNKMCDFNFFYNFCPKYFSFPEDLSEI